MRPATHVLTVTSCRRDDTRLSVYTSVARGPWAADREWWEVVIGVALAHRRGLWRGMPRAVTEVFLTTEDPGEAEAWRP